MSAIWKFPLAFGDGEIVTMPKGARILAAQMQNERLCLWAEVDAGAHPERRAVEIFGTGHQMKPAERTYIGTVQDGEYVWHVFERMDFAGTL